MAGIQEMFQSNDLLKVLLILLGVYLFMNMTSKDKKESLMNMGLEYEREHRQTPVENYKEPEHYEQGHMGRQHYEPYFNEDQYNQDQYNEDQYAGDYDMQVPVYEGIENVPQQPAVVQPAMPQEQQPAPVQVNPEQRVIDQVVVGKPQLDTNDLLPKYDDANEFAKQNPVSNLLKEQNFLISGYHVGINTVMQSNKIPYHDLRSAPPIPKESVGPWSQSSFEVPAGAGRRYFDLGA